MMSEKIIYQKLSDLLEEKTGQVLLANRHWRIEMALKPVMRRNSIPDVDTLVAILDGDSGSEFATHCVEAMINNETCFFRDQAIFALLTGPVLDSLRQQRAASKRLRIWSSACSTGQEPYSLAMAFADNPEKWRDWNIRIIATDVSGAALDQARSGQYSQFEIQRGLPVMTMLKHFRQDGEDWIASPLIRKMVNFSEHNMLRSPHNMGQFDIILCRNMLMYLCEEKRRMVLELLTGSLAPDGILMLGAAETVIGQSGQLCASDEFRGFYQRADKPVNNAIFPKAAAN